jgi:hypothetical protein
MIQYFLKKIIQRGLVFLLLIAIVFIILGNINRKMFVKECKETSAIILFAGDSHIQLGVNDQIITKSKNIANLGEAYIYTYEKIQYYLQYNHGVKQIYLGAGCHNFSEYYDGFSHGRLPDYLPILSLKDQLKHSFDRQYGFVNIISPVLYNGMINVTKHSGQFTFSGGFSNFSVNRMNEDSSILPRINSQFYVDNDRLKSYSENNIKYLKKIISLCKEKGVELDLIATPLHPEYKMSIPSSYLSMRKSFISNEKVRLIDFEDITMPSGSFMPDGDHLTAAGAAYFSKILNDQNRL